MIWARIKGYLAAAGAIMGAILAAWLLGRRDGNRAAQDRLREAERATDRRIDGADISRGDATDNERWLRDRSQR